MFKRKPKEVVEIPKATDVIATIMEEGINSYAFENIKSDSDKRIYYENAQAILRNPVFINEYKSYMAKCIKEIALKADNYDQVIALRFSMNGLKAFKELLEGINFEEKLKQSEEDLYSGI